MQVRAQARPIAIMGEPFEIRLRAEMRNDSTVLDQIGNQCHPQRNLPLRVKAEGRLRSRSQTFDDWRTGARSAL
jgi:hypothetical protein